MSDKPIKYSQDWSAYNKAQVNEHEHFLRLLRDLCEGITMPRQGLGRARTPLCDIVFSAVYKTYAGMSGRRVMGALNKLHDEGILLAKPNYNTLSRYLDQESMTPLLRKLLQESASPLAGIETNFAVDSTGISTKTYERYYDHKWGRDTRKAKFVKTHAICGTLTHVVTDLIVSDRGDATQLSALVDGTGKRFDIREVSADKAYSSKKNLEAIDAAGAVPYIPFREGTTGKGPALWCQMYHYFQYKRADFLSHYHARSNVETVFSMVKGKFGGSVKSKNPTAQTNEVYCKFLGHNICVLIASIYELGIAPEFWKAEGA